MGLSLAMLIRIGLLASISWVMGLTATLFDLFEYDISGRDLILLGGGLFLIAKSTHEIHSSLEGESQQGHTRAGVSFVSTIVQILLLDIVFSLDSVITAVGMAEALSIMVIAVVLAVAVMLFASAPIAEFVERHPTVKMLALSFLLLIGMSLIGEGLDQHIPKAYIYFAMGFSVFVEMLNLRAQAKARPVHLHDRYTE
jgi:predicted tellurium resistance membrane protein TerC